MTKSKIMTIIAGVAAILVLILTAGLIFNAVKGKGSDGETDTPASITEKVDTIALQDLAFLGEGNSSNSIKTTAVALTNNEEVVEGDSTTITLKLTSNVLSEVMLEKVNVPITWKLEFVNPNSDWARGKNVTDYVTIQPQSNFTRTVTITNRAAFGEQIKLTATMELDTDKKASCTIDYVKRIGGGFANLYCASDFGDEFNCGGQVSGEGSTGTIMGTLSAHGTYLELDDGFVSLLKSYLKFDITIKGYAFSNQIVPTIGYHDYYNYYYVEVAVADAQGRAVNLDYSHFISNWNSLSEAQKTAVKYAWWVAYKAYGNNVNIDMVIDYGYGDKTLSNLSGNLSWYISGESYGCDISVDGSLVNIVF